MPNGAKHWCFTDYTVTEERIQELIKIPHDYIIFQKEKCPENSREHYQGFISFHKRTGLSKAKQLFGNSHLEIARHIEAAIDYCAKEESRISGPWEDGVRPKFGRLDLDVGRRTIIGHERWGDVLNDESLVEIVAKYHRWARDVFEHKETKVQVQDLQQRWQLDLLDELAGEPSPRQVLWYWSKEGGTGKSTFARYAAAKLGGLVITRGAGNDIVHAYENHRIIVFDYPRSIDPQFVQWNLMEEFKNGITFSQKYNSRQKIFNTPHVVVFSNINPIDYMYKLSEDRWKIKEL